jgi:hypothetical protein
MFKGLTKNKEFYDLYDIIYMNIKVKFVKKTNLWDSVRGQDRLWIVIGNFIPTLSILTYGYSTM